MGNISNLFKTQTTLNQVLLTHPGYISRKCLSLAICWAFDAPMHYLVVQPATLCSDHTPIRCLQCMKDSDQVVSTVVAI